MTDSIFGHSNFAYGPGNLYWDTATGGADTYLGCTDQISITAEITKIELKCAQEGDRAADRAISAQRFIITLGLARSTVERLEETFQGFEVETDTAGDPERIWLSDLQAQRDSDIWKQMTFFEIIDGVESTDPFGIFDFWRCAPMIESVELIYDAATQRYFGEVFETYRDSTHPDHNGRATYGASRRVA
jgi:hypothetical protein